MTNEPAPPMWVVIRDFGRLGREGIVNPEHTRQNIIDLMKSGEWDRVISVTEVAEGRAIDVTQEFLQAAAVDELELA